MNAADLLVSEGYADLGYKYVIVDDCWLAKNRSHDGKLVADKKRFPSGIKALSDYVSRIISILLKIDYVFLKFRRFFGTGIFLQSVIWRLKCK